MHRLIQPFWKVQGQTLNTVGLAFTEEVGSVGGSDFAVDGAPVTVNGPAGTAIILAPADTDGTALGQLGDADVFTTDATPQVTFVGSGVFTTDPDDDKIQIRGSIRAADGLGPTVTSAQVTGSNEVTVTYSDTASNAGEWVTETADGSLATFVLVIDAATTVTGTVFTDTNGNGVEDDEAGILWYTMTAINLVANQIRTVDATSDGTYAFENVRAEATTLIQTGFSQQATPSRTWHPSGSRTWNLRQAARKHSTSGSTRYRSLSAPC